MQLVLELCDTGADTGESSMRKVFERAGGVIGRGTGCDWVILDSSRLLSSHHALISYRDEQYFLTDISRNGIRLVGSDTPLHKGQAHLIAEGDIFQLGSLSIRAGLVVEATRPGLQSPVSRGIIPDDAYLDPLDGLAREQSHETTFEGLSARKDPAGEHEPWACRGPVERDHLVVPTRAAPCAEVPPVKPLARTASDDPAFWSRFGESLGICLETLDAPGREALAIKVAGLFRLAVDGLQQSLRTHEELKHEFNLGDAGRSIKSQNPLKDSVDVHGAISALLGTGALGQLPAELAIAQACRDIQVHQLAVLVACRTVTRNTLAAFSPGHLLLCFEHVGKSPRFGVDGAYWRAYRRHYQQRVEENAQGERQLRADFARAYDEQMRLVSTLYAGCPG